MLTTCNQIILGANGTWRLAIFDLILLVPDSLQSLHPLTRHYRLGFQHRPTIMASKELHRLIRKNYVYHLSQSGKATANSWDVSEFGQVFDMKQIILRNPVSFQLLDQSLDAIIIGNLEKNIREIAKNNTKIRNPTFTSLEGTSTMSTGTELKTSLLKTRHKTLPSLIHSSKSVFGASMMIFAIQCNVLCSSRTSL